MTENTAKYGYLILQSRDGQDAAAFPLIRQHYVIGRYDSSDNLIFLRFSSEWY